MSPLHRPLPLRAGPPGATAGPRPRPHTAPRRRAAAHLLSRPALAVLALALAGCASLAPDDTLGPARARLAGTEPAAPGAASTGTPATNPGLQLWRSAEAESAARQRAEALLAQPLSADAAQQLALLHSPALQALLADAWQRDAALSQARLPFRPRLGLERVAQAGLPAELTQTLGIGIAELVLWPQRSRVAQAQIRRNRLQLARDVLQGQQQLRQQWVRTVAAAELAHYQAQVADVAETGAELARRMQAAGHFSRLQATREAVLAADAQGRAARSRQAALAEREALVRGLGLDTAQAARLRLPDRLPDLPAAAADAAQAEARAAERRLDLALARDELASSPAPLAARAGAADAELSISRTRQGDERRHGLALDLVLPLDGGALASQGAEAGHLAARARLAAAERAAASQLRERVAAQRAAWALARQARETLLPLSQTLSDETLLRYNGMLSSVFELLAAAREQVGVVVSALEAQRDFWLADAALQAALDGLPAAATDSPGADAGSRSPASAGPAGNGH